jgi:CRP/FNR family cyclic AMP-dependent transcriptional regulator
MSIDPVVSTLARVPLFAGLTPQHIQQILLSAERIVFQSGDVIQSEGDIADAAILLVSGKAVLVDALDGQAVDFVAPGSLIGELAMLIETRAVSTVVAHSTVRAFRIPRLKLRAAMERDPELADHFVARINARLSAMAEEMRRVDRLVAGSLAHLSPATATTHPVH